MFILTFSDSSDSFRFDSLSSLFDFVSNNLHFGTIYYVSNSDTNFSCRLIV